MLARHSSVGYWPYPQTLYYPGKAFQPRLLFALSKPFQPSLIFADKARAYPSEIPFRCFTPVYAPRHTHKHYTILERLLSLLFALSKPFQPSIIFVCKDRAYTSESPFRCSTLGYAPGRTYKHYTIQERLSRLLFALSKPFQPSLIFARKARAYPSEIPFRCSTPGYAPGRTLKHYTILERLSRLLFALSKPFQPSLIFFGKARAYPSESPFRCSTLGSASGLTQ